MTIRPEALIKLPKTYLNIGIFKEIWTVIFSFQLKPLVAYCGNYIDIYWSSFLDSFENIGNGRP